jgi:16S rRNA G527 N7-methylase RsmG
MLKINRQEMLGRYIDFSRVNLFLDEVTAANEKFNLYSRNLTRNDLQVLIAESFIPVELGWIIGGGGPLLDIGSGWGIPAVPLLLAGLDLEVTMVERSRKKADFLFLLLRRLKIEAEIIDGGLEKITRQSPFKVVTLRGVAVDRKVIHSLRKMVDPAASLIYFGPRPGELVRSVEDVDYIVDNLPVRRIVRAQIK